MAEDPLLLVIVTFSQILNTSHVRVFQRAPHFSEVHSSSRLSGVTVITIVSNTPLFVIFHFYLKVFLLNSNFHINKTGFSRTTLVLDVLLMPCGLVCCSLFVPPVSVPLGVNFPCQSSDLHDLQAEQKGFTPVSY